MATRQSTRSLATCARRSSPAQPLPRSEPPSPTPYTPPLHGREWGRHPRFTDRPPPANAVPYNSGPAAYSGAGSGRHVLLDVDWNATFPNLVKESSYNVPFYSGSTYDASFPAPNRAWKVPSDTPSPQQPRDLRQPLEQAPSAAQKPPPLSARPAAGGTTITDTLTVITDLTRIKLLSLPTGSTHRPIRPHFPRRSRLSARPWPIRKAAATSSGATPT